MWPGSVDVLEQVLVILSLFIFLFYYLLLLVRGLFRAGLSCKASVLLSLSFFSIMVIQIAVNALYSVVFGLQLWRNEAFGLVFFEQVNANAAIICDGLQVTAILALARCYTFKYISIRQMRGSKLLFAFLKLVILIVVVSILTVVALYNL
jgi:hypothetical protein